MDAIKNADIEMPTDAKSPAFGASDLIQEVKKIDALLENGGPPPNRGVLLAYLADALDDQEKAAVERRITTYREWFRECWKVFLETEATALADFGVAREERRLLDGR